MLKATAFTNADKPVITANFTPYLDRYAAADVTLSSCAVAIRAYTGTDASASSRLDGSVSTSGAYAQQRLTGCTEGVDYLLEFTGTFSDGAKETIQILAPCRDVL